jgi:hypothetical protein
MNTRKRLINFRVTDDELLRLKHASSLRNARCLSEFARSAILETARTYESLPEANGSVAEQLLAFDRRLSRLEHRMSRIFDAIAEAQSATLISEG